MGRKGSPSTPNPGIESVHILLGLSFDFYSAVEKQASPLPGQSALPMGNLNAVHRSC